MKASSLSQRSRRCRGARRAAELPRAIPKGFAIDPLEIPWRLFHQPYTCFASSSSPACCCGGRYGGRRFGRNRLRQIWIPSCLPASPCPKSRYTCSRRRFLLPFLIACFALCRLRAFLLPVRVVSVLACAVVALFAGSSAPYCLAKNSADDEVRVYRMHLASCARSSPRFA
jgi:hypothetical protein